MTVVHMRLTGLLVLLCGVAFISMIPGFSQMGVVVAALGAILVIYSALTAADGVNMSALKRILCAAAIPAGIVAVFFVYLAIGA